MAKQGMIAGFRLYIEPPMDDTSEKDDKRGNSQLRGVLGFRHFGSRVDLALSNQAFP